jgi:hypothetical protein
MNFSNLPGGKDEWQMANLGSFGQWLFAETERQSW